MIHEVTPIYVGSFTLRFGEFENATIPSFQNIPNFVFLITHEGSAPMLVDTGFRREHLPGMGSSCELEQSLEIGNALRAHGVTPKEISTVIMTHLHWDHTGGMEQFSNAEFVVQSHEMASLVDLKPNEETYYVPSHFISCIDRMRLVNGTWVLKPGITLKLTGRHTSGHQVVEVQTDCGPVLLAGDAHLRYDNFSTLLPDAYWSAFRKGCGRGHYWGDDVGNTIKTFADDNGLMELGPPETNRIGRLVSHNTIVYTGHDNSLFNKHNDETSKG